MMIDDNVVQRQTERLLPPSFKVYEGDLEWKSTDYDDGKLQQKTDEDYGHVVPENIKETHGVLKYPKSMNKHEGHVLNRKKLNETKSLARQLSSSNHKLYSSKHNTTSFNIFSSNNSNDLSLKKEKNLLNEEFKRKYVNPNTSEGGEQVTPRHALRDTNESVIRVRDLPTYNQKMHNIKYNSQQQNLPAHYYDTDSDVQPYPRMHQSQLHNKTEYYLNQHSHHNHLKINTNKSHRLPQFGTNLIQSNVTGEFSRGRVDMDESPYQNHYEYHNNQESKSYYFTNPKQSRLTRSDSVTKITVPPLNLPTEKVYLPLNVYSPSNPDNRKIFNTNKPNRFKSYHNVHPSIVTSRRSTVVDRTSDNSLDSMDHAPLDICGMLSPKLERRCDEFLPCNDIAESWNENDNQRYLDMISSHHRKSQKDSISKGRKRSYMSRNCKCDGRAVAVQLGDILGCVAFEVGKGVLDGVLELPDAIRNGYNRYKMYSEEGYENRFTYSDHDSGESSEELSPFNRDSVSQNSNEDMNDESLEAEKPLPIAPKANGLLKKLTTKYRKKSENSDISDMSNLAKITKDSNSTQRHLPHKVINSSRKVENFPLKQQLLPKRSSHSTRLLPESGRVPTVPRTLMPRSTPIPPMEPSRAIISQKKGNLSVQQLR